MSIGLGGHAWVDAAVSGAIGLVAVPPVLLRTAYGIWKENRLDQYAGWAILDFEPVASSVSVIAGTPGNAAVAVSRVSGCPQLIASCRID